MTMIPAGTSEGREREFNPQRIITTFVLNNSPMDLYARLREKVLGQDETCRKLSILLYAFLKSLADGTYLDRKYHCMLVGESGCGKSTIFNALQTILYSIIPVRICDSSQLSAPGWKGCDPVQVLDDDEIDRFGCAIICADEWDKACLSQGGSAENHHRYLQEGFLKMMDGGMVHDKDGKAYDCSRVMFIFAGAFTPLREIPSEGRSIGFGMAPTVVKKEKRSVIDRETLTAACKSEQFMGRIICIMNLHRLSTNHYKIMVEDAIKEVCNVYGGYWDLPQEVKDNIVQLSISSSYGGRNIRNMVWGYFVEGDAFTVKEKTNTLPKGEELDRILAEAIRQHNMLSA